MKRIKICLLAPPNNTPISTLWKQSACNVKIGIVSCSPRIGRCCRRHDFPCIFHGYRVFGIHIKSLSDTRLSDIIPCSPCKITNHIWMTFHHRPSKANLLGEILRPEHHSFRIPNMVVFIEFFHIIVADNIQAIAKSFCTLFPKSSIQIIRSVLALILTLCQIII